MRRRLATLAAAQCVLAASAALAQGGWAVQVVALRDYREAQAASTQLQGIGFPSYLEFSMNGGHQFVRVRVGCFSDREAADAMAEAMRGHVTADAQPVELSPGATPPGCAEEAVGFLNGYDWHLLEDDGPVTFGVSVAGVPATVVHDGGRWRMVQDDGVVPPLDPASGSATFTERSIGGSTFAVLTAPGGPVIVCPGRLLAQVGAFAIVERGDAVLSCRWTPGSEG